MPKRTSIAIPAAMLAFSGLALAGIGLGSGLAQAQIEPAPVQMPCSNDVMDPDFCGFGGGGGGGGGNPFGTGPGQIDLLPGVTENGPTDLTPGAGTDLTPGGPPPAQSNTANGCIEGYVPRLARPSDLVCSTPAVAERTAQENANPTLNREPGGGAYGPDTCKQGFVWREAFDGDTICVTPEIRAQTLADNATAASRKTN